MPTREKDRLATTAIDQFRTDGYLGPYKLCEPEEMATVRGDVERVLQTPPPDHDTLAHNRHMDHRCIYDLATHPAIVSRMASIYGEDLLLWRTNFFVKEPGAREIPWHQDYNYWPLEPAVIISAWIAVDPSTEANSCLQLIPGSHRNLLPHVTAGKEMAFHEMADPSLVDGKNARKIEMQPGEFVLFNERTLHHSSPNASLMRRIGLAVRVIVPIVKVLDWDSPNHGLMQISGRDPLAFNRHTDPPRSD
jgi:ectoine hydroxylase-related dioxygenase (phytanoyl-CoA dioxygenase family)